MENCDILLIFAQNIDRMYTLEVPHWGGSYENPRSILKGKNKKIMYKSKRKAMNRNWYNQKANPALNTKAGNK